MSKLVRLWVFLAITGLMAACGESPVDLSYDDCSGVPDPNSYCDSE